MFKQIIDQQNLELTHLKLLEARLKVVEKLYLEQKSAINEALIELDREKENQRYNKSMSLIKAVNILEGVK